MFRREKLPGLIETTMTSDNLPVVVLIGGFGLPASELADSCWGPEFLGRRDARVIAVRPAPFASLHDRACQIFAELMGVAPRYGADHPTSLNSDGDGDGGGDGESCAAGRYPEWGGDRPVHLVGHSYGGLTARVRRPW